MGPSSDWAVVFGTEDGATFSEAATSLFEEVEAFGAVAAGTGGMASSLDSVSSGRQNQGKNRFIFLK